MALRLVTRRTRCWRPESDGHREGAKLRLVNVLSHRRAHDSMVLFGLPPWACRPAATPLEGQAASSGGGCCVEGDGRRFATLKLLALLAIALIAASISATRAFDSQPCQHPLHLVDLPLGIGTASGGATDFQARAGPTAARLRHWRSTLLACDTNWWSDRFAGPRRATARLPRVRPLA